MLGEGVLNPGKSLRVDLHNYNSSIFDVRLEDEDGDSYTFWDVDVEKYNLVVTLDDLD